MFEQQAAQILNFAAQQASIVARLEKRLATMEEERIGIIASTTTPVVHTPATITTDTTDVVRKPKHSLLHPDKYDGSTPGFFSQFEGLLEAKLAIDGLAIGQEKEQVWYGFGRFSGDAAARIFPWMLYAAQENKFMVGEFIGQLRTAFRDPCL